MSRSADPYAEHAIRCRAFARARGWSLARRRFTLLDLAVGRRVSDDDGVAVRTVGSRWRDRVLVTGIDHSACFTRDGRPVATLSQPYRDAPGGPDFVAALERAFATCGVPLRVSTPPEPSWWYPGWTVAVLFEPVPIGPRPRDLAELAELDEAIVRAFELAGVRCQ